MLEASWVALSLADHVGGKKLRALMRHFDNDPAAVLNADAETLRQVPGIGPKIAQIIRDIRLIDVENAIPGWQAAGVTLLPLQDSRYPERLRPLDDAPPTLFVIGHGNLNHTRAAAVVGTRRPSPDSEALARQIALRLASRGCVVVSGLALGVDRAAHVGALDVPDGETLAVLGSGVLNVFPEANDALAEQIIQRGALLSEVHPQAQANRASLVARNRLISAMSDAVIIVETAVDGGAMHAARRARAQGRKVYAVDNAASGNRALIAEGAVPLRVDLSNLEEV